MSILIKGMEMPKSCKDCPCHKFAYDNWDRPYNYCGVTGGVTLVNCPLVEVPTPHGDLVDRDDLIDEINRVTFVKRYDYDVAYNIVTDAETIIEAEVSE